ncbi:hypothetical protein LRY60_02475 [Candidatus Woesebacteria bacterium]|nr:hypothetical protein [Candidatus Woesebacteria bacterium]
MPPNNPFAESHDLFLEQFEQVNHLFDFDEEILKIYDTIFGEQIKNLRLIKATAAVRKAEEMRIFLKEKMHLTQQLSVPFELLYDHAIVYSVSTLENFLSDIFQKCLTHLHNEKFEILLKFSEKETMEKTKILVFLRTCLLNTNLIFIQPLDQ